MEVFCFFYLVGHFWGEVRELYRPHMNLDNRKQQDAEQAQTLRKFYTGNKEKSAHTLRDARAKAAKTVTNEWANFVRYANSEGNLVDFSLLCLFLIIFILRISGLLGLFPEPVNVSVRFLANSGNVPPAAGQRECQKHCGVFNGSVAEVYLLAQCAMTVLLCIKLLQIFLLHPSLGPLLRIIGKMWSDVRNFAGERI